MSLSFYNFKILKLLFDEESVKQVAEKMFISQSAVSHQLRVIERHFEIELFERRGRNIIPTKAGVIVNTYITNILEQYNQLENAVNDVKFAKSGDISIAGSINLGTYVLPTIVSKFIENNPAIHLNLQVYNTKEALSLTAQGDIDFCLVPFKLATEHLIYEYIRAEEIVITAAPNSSNKPRNLKELEEAPFICAPKGTQFRETIDTSLAKFGVERSNIIMEVGHPEGAKQAVRAGLGLGSNFRFVVQEEIDLGLLEEVHIEGLELYGQIYLAYRPHKYFLPAERKLIDLIKEELM